MARYFKNVKSFEDLKNQFRNLIKANHPDNGGDAEAMKEINVEYEALFPIWKNRHETQTGETVAETAESTRSEFYTAYGWKGSRHDWNRSLKEIAQIVRAYVKEKYPTYKFSVRTSYASMCQELHVELKESPVDIYKTIDELTEDDRTALRRKLYRDGIFTKNGWCEEELTAAIVKAWDDSGSWYKVINEVTKAVADDVDAFVDSYNFQDCDGSIDYFRVDFYYFGCLRENGKNVKIVPKTARIKNSDKAPAKEEKTAQKSKEEPQKIEEKAGYTYKITRGEDTRDGSVLWVVRIQETLTREQYIAENKRMKNLGGYYSKFKHGFIFRVDPSETLKTA